MILSPYGLFGLSNINVTRYSSSMMISESQGLFGLSNPTITHESNSLMIYEFLGAVWVVESMCQP